DAVAWVDENAKETVDERPRPRGDEDLLGGIRQAATPLIEVRHGASQDIHSWRRRIVRLTRLKRLDDAVEQWTRYRKVRGREVADGEVAQVAPGLTQGANLGGDAKNGRSAELVGEMGETRRGLDIGRLHCF